MQTNNLNKLSFLALRLMGSLIFITAGLNHLFQTAQAAARLQQAKMGFLATGLADPEMLVILSGIGLLTGGFMLMAGFQTKKAALLLLLILIPITITMQMGSAASMGPLFKNIAIMGVLLFFMVNGAVHYSLDCWLERRKLMAEKANATVKMVVMAFAGILLFSSCSTAQAVTKPAPAEVTARKNYGILISQPDHLRAAVHTAQTMRKEPKYKADKIVVMACAKSVEAFKKDGEMIAFYEAGIAAGVTFKVCGMSLEKFKVAPENVLDGAEVIPNGLTYMFDLQQEGFVTVEL